MFRKVLIGSFVVVVLGLAAGCEGSDGSTDPIAIAGSWVDSYGMSYVVTDVLLSLDMGEYGISKHHITVYDNATGYAIAQNDAGNAFSADLWSRFDWLFDGDGILWYCQTAYGAETEAEALATAAADSTDLDAGCNDFAWTALTAVN